MKVAYFARAVGVAVLSLIALIDVSSNTLVQQSQQCSKKRNYKRRGYKIRQARIDDPWSFLHFGSKSSEADKKVAELQGKAYDFDEVDAVFKLVEAERIANSNFSVSSIGLENCSSTERQLDVVFKIFAVDISPVSTSTFESHQAEKDDPAEVAGVPRKKRVVFVPAGGFDETSKFVGGGRLNIRGNGPIDTVSLGGVGGPEAGVGEGSVTGSFESVTRLVSRAEWRVDYTYASLPTDRAQRKIGSVSVQANGMTRPLKGTVFRFGTQMEGGNLQSTFTPASLGPRVLPSSDYSSFKLYAGVTAHPRHQAIAASYGVEFGSAGSSFHGDWRKQVGDLAYDFWLPVGDHRTLEVEQRLTGGTVNILRSVPVNALFFGGNREEQFNRGDTWAIRANPVIRSIPSNRFYQTRDGAGAEKFIAYNSTVGFTVWRKPLVPLELSHDEDFKKKMKATIKSATNTLQVTHESADSHFREAFELLPAIADKLQALLDVAQNLPSSDACTEAADSVRTDVLIAKDKKPSSAYGYIKEFLPGGDSSLADVVTTCKTDLGAAVTPAANEVDARATQMKKSFDSINTEAAKTKAENDMSYVQRTLNIIIDDLNIASVSPLFVFDVAHVGPASSGPYSGTRYGVGGGLRFSLVNTVNFSGGYAVNPTRLPGEPRGAVFFSISTRQLFW